MDNTTLAQELEAIAHSGVIKLGFWTFANRTAIYDALRNPAPAPVGGEPVAYRFDHEWDGPDFGVQPLTDADKAAGWTETPLYAAPQAQPTGDCHET